MGVTNQTSLYNVFENKKVIDLKQNIDGFGGEAFINVSDAKDVNDKTNFQEFTSETILNTKRSNFDEEELPVYDEEDIDDPDTRNFDERNLEEKEEEFEDVRNYVII